MGRKDGVVRKLFVMAYRCIAVVLRKEDGGGEQLEETNNMAPETEWKRRGGRQRPGRGKATDGKTE